MTDPIVDEVRRAGASLFARHGNDMHAVVEYLRLRGEKAGRPTVSLPPKPARQIPTVTQKRKAG